MNKYDYKKQQQQQTYELDNARIYKVMNFSNSIVINDTISMNSNAQLWPWKI